MANPNLPVPHKQDNPPYRSSEKTSLFLTECADQPCEHHHRNSSSLQKSIGLRARWRLSVFASGF